MGNRTNIVNKLFRPSSLGGSAPTSERGQKAEKSEKGDKGDKGDKGEKAKATVIKVLGSPMHARNSQAPSPLPTLAAPSGLQVNGLASPAEAVAPALMRNPKLDGAEKPLGRRAPRSPLAKVRQTKRGSIGPGSRSPSQERHTPATTTVPTSNSSLAGETARKLKDAKDSTRAYKAATCDLLSDWKGKPELESLDSFLALDAELIHYLGRIFSLAPELEETGFRLEDIMDAGLVFLCSCRKEGGANTVQLSGTTFEGHDVQYFEHLNSFFNLVSSNLDFANLRQNKVEIGKVVDFRDTDVSRKVMATLSTLQQVWDKILDKTLFDDF